jgi:hypothetical protein
MVHKIERSSKYYDEKTYLNDIANLDLILKNAKMTDALKNAIIELKDALKKKDYNMAYELSAVKSLIVSNLKFKEASIMKKNAFREDSKSNEKILGDSLYGYLDGLHHKITFNLMRGGKKDIVPSGMIVMSGSTTGLTIKEKGLSKLESSILKRMNYEFEETKREAERRFKK